jgi:hypothetical protein
MVKYGTETHHSEKSCFLYEIVEREIIKSMHVVGEIFPHIKMKICLYCVFKFECVNEYFNFIGNSKIF